MPTAKISLKTEINGSKLEDSLETKVATNAGPEEIELEGATDKGTHWEPTHDGAMFKGVKTSEIRFLSIKSSLYFDEYEVKECENKKEWCVWYKIKTDTGWSKKIPLLGPHYHVGEFLRYFCCDGEDKKIEQICFYNGLCKKITITLFAGIVKELPKCTRNFEKPADTEIPADPCEEEEPVPSCGGKTAD